ncbi:hypothetical protein GLOIN_2v1778859 [Rhizophagus clarus]|uniref:Uncharacterized protein n=1 Tax=Rhizophagus clarus TaxID=94130 RepID=A0A8H3KX75_9GLOM|nr:hypothetical protein GLOIN_2v1778859 [Rhizophagus clarus]
MEEVENINSVNTGGTSTASTESQGTLNNSQQETNAGLEASIHTQAQIATTTTATSNQQNEMNKIQSRWIVIGKSQKITLFFPLDLPPGQKDTEKKNYVFRYVVVLTRIFSTTTIKGVKMIKVGCETEDAANKVMAKTIVVNNLTKFSKMESFTQNQPNLQSDFEIKIWDIPLDIEKDLFEQHLRSLDQVKKIKFAIKNLYYEVSVTFANKDLAGALKEEWSMKFLNKTIRIFSSTLTKEKRNYHFKYVLKLTNLPKGTNGKDLLEIVTCIRAKAVFVPKNCFSQNYKKEGFA